MLIEKNKKEIIIIQYILYINNNVLLPYDT